MLRQILVLVGIFIIIALGALIFSAVTGAGKKEIKIGEAIFKVRIYDNPASRSLGLSGTKILKEDEGMLFLFSEEEIQKFWMKDMKFPIDIIWIKGNTVVGIIMGAEPEPLVVSGAEPDYTIYSSPEPVDKVLEINAGLSQRLGIRVGDTVVFSSF